MSVDPPETRTYQGITVTRVNDYTWVDAEGTKYVDFSSDPGFCGVAPGETGKGDPFWKIACVPHDLAFDKMKVGYEDSTKDNLKTFGTFVADIGTGMLQGAYMVALGVPYIVVGGIGGMLRWAFLTDK